MPGERLTVRGTSEVGRFPGAAPPTRVELTIHKEGEKKQEEGGCRRWFKKMCPCCLKRQTSTSYDVTDKVDLIKPPAPAPEPAKPKPENGEAKEMEGNVMDFWGELLYEIVWTRFSSTLWTVLHVAHVMIRSRRDTDMRLHFLLNPPLSEIKLTVRSVDLLSSKTGQNRQEHHTDLYHGEELIIRRGQTFQIELELNRPFNADTDKLHLDMKTGMK